MFSLTVCVLFSRKFFSMGNIKVKFSLGYDRIQQCISLFLGISENKENYFNTFCLLYKTGFYDLKCDLYWRTFHELWKRMFIPQPLKYSVGSVKYNWKSISTLKFVCWVLVLRLGDLPIDKNRFLTLPNIPVTGPICLSESSSIYIMRSSLSTFGTCIIASWKTEPPY